MYVTCNPMRQVDDGANNPTIDRDKPTSLQCKATRSESFPLFKNLHSVSVHVTDALWADVNDAYVKASCTG